MARALTNDEQKLLLKLARATLEAEFGPRASPPCEVVEGPLCEHRGAFVTLTKDGQLRGCIGHVTGVEPLWRSVVDNARGAAFRDPRFPALQPEELETVVIEISALSPLEIVDGSDEITVGSHGLLLERGLSRGLLLPQVAARYGWDAATFLDQTCRKAGMEPGCWRAADTTIYRFTVDSFSEEDDGTG